MPIGEKQNLKKRIFLAIGNRDFEDYLKGVLFQRYSFVGETTYREGILTGIEKNGPDIVIIRESLPGARPIMEILYEIRDKFPDTRIIFMATKRDVGDAFLAMLVNYGIYDFMAGSTTNVRDVIKLIDVPNKFEDVKKFLPRPEEDERGRMVFKAPEIEPEIVIKEVVIKEDQEKEKKKSNIFGGLSRVISGTLKGKEKEKKEEKPIKKESVKEVIIKEDKPKETLNIPKKEKVRRVREKVIESPQTVNTANRVITFISGKSGAGSTSIAVNTAYKLAEKGYKVIYLEFNFLDPSVAYWLDLGKAEEGIDTCMEYLRKFEFTSIGKTIIKSSVIKEQKSSMGKRYKSLPDTLDFMFFSKAYISGLKEKISMKDSKELYVHLMFQLGYDFIILDLPSDISRDETRNGLIFCNKIYSVLTQDVSSVGYYLLRLYDLAQEGVEIRNKNTFILNRFVEGSIVDEKYIKDWIRSVDLIKVPRDDLLFIKANAEGLLALSIDSSRKVEVAINRIVANILS